MADLQPVSRDGLVVCACRGQEYTARDAIDAALFRGELDSLWKEFLSNVAAEKHAKELEAELDDDAIDEMAEMFRYQHDLITAEETEKWLEQRGLTLEEFSDYFVRRHWREALGEDIPADATESEFVSASADLRDLFIIELICADELDPLTKQFMWRLAARAANAAEDVDPQQVASKRQEFLDRNQIKPEKLGAWLKQIDRDEEWLNENAKMEVIFAKIVDNVLTPQMRKKQLALLRMPLTHFEAELIQVESRDAAREALLCMREDGMSMQEVAGDARYPYHRISFRHEDIPPEWQQKFWSVGAGDLLDPLPRGDGFEIYRITKKSEPDLEDAIVQERIDQRLLEQHFSALVREHVEARLQGVVVE
jgi:hypothetical protein